MDYEDAHARFNEEIKKIARSQYMPDMDTDDIENEMRIVLWNAVKVHDPSKGPLGGLWWKMWKNHRKNYLDAYYAQKRVRAIPMDVLPHPNILSTEEVREVPSWVKGMEVNIWTKLAQGDTAIEVQRDLGLRKRDYYEVIERWCNSQTVYKYLTR